MDEPPFTIRIHIENHQDMDWIVRLEEVTFRQTLVSFEKFCSDVTHMLTFSF